jgi:hypothetical protein
MNSPLIEIASLSLLAGLGLTWIAPTNIAHAQATAQPDVAALKEEVESLKRLLPSQSHAMADVDYHFSNLWFAAQNTNWPLAEFYVNETRSHLNWTVRLRPVRRLAAGGEIDLRPILQGIESSGLADIKASIGKQDLKAFGIAYRATMTQCYGCHMAAEKPYLRLRIPETPSTRMIDIQGRAN